MPVQFNWSIVGHEKIQQYLQQSLLTQKVGQFYVFAGPRDIGKKSLARKFAQSLLCEKNELAKTEKVVLPCGQCRHCRDFASGRYADYYFLNREINAKTEKRKTQISVEQVRNLIDKINMSSFSTKDYPKIVIIDEAESLSAEAANSLLKTLEEPNGRIVIFLLVENKDLLLPTILSRAQVLRFSTIDQDKIYENLLERENISRDLAKEVAGFSGGRYVTAMEYLQNPQSFSEQKEKISQAFSLLTQTNARKFQKIEELLGQENETEKVVSRLDDFSAIGRDLLLAQCGLQKLLQNVFLAESYEKVKNQITATDLLSFLMNIEFTKKNIWQNVSPRLAMENLLLNFSIKK